MLIDYQGFFFQFKSGNKNRYLLGLIAILMLICYKESFKVVICMQITNRIAYIKVVMFMSRFLCSFVAQSDFS